METQQGELWETPAVSMDRLVFQLIQDIGELAQLRCRLYDLKGTTYKQCHLDHQEVLTRIAIMTTVMADRLGFNIADAAEKVVNERQQQRAENTRRVSDATVYSGGECGHQQRPTFDLDEE